jgi:hypothetical protein
MKTISTFGILLSILFLVSCGGESTDSNKKEQVNTDAKSLITFVSGKATIKRDMDVMAIKIGMEIRAKDIVSTSKGAEIDIETPQGVLRIKENSTIAFQSVVDGQVNDTSIAIKNGKILLGLNKIKKDQSLTLNTPTAVIGVRGTSFVVDADDETTKVAVLTGLVGVKKGNDETSVDSRSELVFKNGDKLATVKVQPISRESLEDVKEIATIKNIGNVQDFNEIRDSLKKYGIQINSDGSIKVDESELYKLNSTTLDNKTQIQNETINNQNNQKNIEKQKRKNSGSMLGENETF